MPAAPPRDPQATVTADCDAPPAFRRAGKDVLTLSVRAAAEVLGVSDDLIYELTERGVLPCLRVGRRKLIPRRAIDLVIEEAVARFARRRSSRASSSNNTERRSLREPLTWTPSVPAHQEKLRDVPVPARFSRGGHVAAGRVADRDHLGLRAVLAGAANGAFQHAGHEV